MFRTQPQLSFLVLFNGSDTILCNSVTRLIFLQLFFQEIITKQAIIGTDPQASTVFLGNTCGSAVVRTVLTEGVEPVLFLNVETAHTHRGRRIDSLLIG